MLPFGPWHPDAAGINSPAMLKAKGCLPAVMDTPNGPVPAFAPELQPKAVSDALADDLLDDAGNIITDDSGNTIFSDASASSCLGLVSTVQNNGSVVQFAGTATALFELVATTWLNVTRAAGLYTTAAGERWRFAAFNPYVIGTNYSDVPQKFDTSGGPGTKFTALGGSPPKARFIAIVRDQVVLGALAGAENEIQWSGYNNSEIWTGTGTNGADSQEFPDGGPITGLVGGAVGHVFQASKVTRMTLTQTTAPDGTPLIYQFDEVQGGKGCVASNSIVKVGDQVFYFASDGFQVLSISTGQVKPIGVNKWRQWFLEDYRPGSESFILGAYDPLNPIVKWAYISNSVTGFIPGRIVNYNWAIDEATYEDLSVEALSQWLTSGVTLDTMGGELDSLPFSLDSPFWRGGAALLSLIDANHQLNFLEGTPMQAEFITADGMKDGRAFIRGTTPVVDTTAVTVAVSMRERDGDAANNQVVFPPQEVMEDTGMCSAHTSGNIARAQIIIPAGSRWTMLKGIKTSLGKAGGR